MRDQIVDTSLYLNQDVELLKLITGFNKQRLSEEKKDRLDELITKNEINMHLFEIFTDKKLRKPLRRAIESMKNLSV